MLDLVNVTIKLLTSDDTHTMQKYRISTYNRYKAKDILKIPRMLLTHLQQTNIDFLKREAYLAKLYSEYFTLTPAPVVKTTQVTPKACCYSQFRIRYTSSTGVEMAFCKICEKSTEARIVVA